MARETQPARGTIQQSCSGPDSGPVTSATLLDRLKLWDDSEAWSHFVKQYSPMLERWSRNRLTSSADVDEVNQQVWCELAQRLTSFEYNHRKSFRGWLRTIHSSRLLDFLKSEKRRMGKTIAFAELLQQRSIGKTRETSSTSHALSSHAIRPQVAAIEQRVQARVSPQTWKIFCEVAIDGQTVADTARRYAMRYTSAFAAYSRVCRMLHEEATK